MKGQKYYIILNRKKVDVSEKIYKEYQKYLNHEIYEAKQYKNHKISLVYDLEEQSDRIEDKIIKEILIKKLNEILLKLSSDEAYLIKRLYFDQKSERFLAKEMHLTQGAIHTRKTKIIKKLKKMLNS